MGKIKWASSIPVLFFFLFAATPAFGLSMEYYTYGGFRPVVQAFTKVALIFSDADYNGLLFVIMVLGLLAGCAAFILQATTGIKIVPLVWAVPVMLGAVLYLSLFERKGEITVYDPVYNRFETVGDVPDGIVFTAGFLNKIERGFVDIIETAGSPDAYQKTAGGLGFKALQAIQSSLPKDNNLRGSTISYIKDCVTFELRRPGTDLSLEELRNETENFLDSLEKAASPAIYTVYYDNTTPSGKTVTCRDSWGSLRAIYSNYTNSNYKESLKKVCGKTHFDPNDRTEMEQCKELISNTLRSVTGKDRLPELLVQQQEIAELLYAFFYTHDPETNALALGNKEIVSRGMGIGLMMNEWIPIIRAIMTSIAIGIIPFLVIFMFTPVVSKALSVMFGFFVFLTTWGITDAVIHSAAMDYATYAFEDMSQSNLGVYSMIAMPSLAVKQMTMFGVIRSAGLMLASFFSMMLIKFGGHALAMMASNLTSITQRGGDKGSRMLNVDEAANEMNKEISAVGMLQGFAEHRFTNLAAARAFDAYHKNVGSYNVAKSAQQYMEKTGALPGGLTDGQLAESMAGSSVSVAGHNGKNTMTISNGHVAFNTAENMEGDAHTRTTTGAAGDGIRTDTFASGEAEFLRQNGHLELTSAKVNGVNPVNVARTAQQQYQRTAANELSTSDRYNRLMGELKRASQSNQVARNILNSLKNADAGEWQRGFNSGSDYGHGKSIGVKDSSHAGVGASFIVSGSYSEDVAGNTSESVNFKVGESTSESFRINQERLRSDAIKDVLSNTESRDYMENLTKNMGFTDAAKDIRNASDMERFAISHGSDLTTALVRDYSIEHFGDASPDNIHRTINHFNSLVTREGAAGVAEMDGIIGKFIDSNGYSNSDTGQKIQNVFANARNRIAGQTGLQSAVEQSAARAESKAGGVASGDYPQDIYDAPGNLPPDVQNRLSKSGQDVAGSLDQPSLDGVREKSDALRGKNRQEVKGDGRIKTGIIERAAEEVRIMVTGESSGDRPTDDESFGKDRPSPPRK